MIDSQQPEPQLQSGGARTGRPEAAGEVRQRTAVAVPETTETPRALTPSQAAPVRIVPVVTDLDAHRGGRGICSPRGSARLFPLQQFVQWSADGTSVFFTQGHDVFVAAADGTRVRQLVDSTPIEFDEREAGHSPDLVGHMSAISVSPDSSRLVYSTCAYPYSAGLRGDGPLTTSSYQYDIAVVSVAGGAPHRLASGDSFDNYPMWSPDGSRIAFLSDRRLGRPGVAWAQEIPHLYTMAPDGSAMRDLTPEHRNLLHYPPQWSADGEWLAFVTFEYVPGRQVRFINVIRTDGTELRRLAAAVSGPSWAPNGQRLAFAQADETAVTLVTMEADGSDVRPVTTVEPWWQKGSSSSRNPLHAWIETVAWSPGGTKILVRPNGDQPAFVADVDLPHRTSVGVSQAAAWAPDGARLVLLEPTHVVTVSADGRRLGTIARWLKSDETWHPVNVGAVVGPADIPSCTGGSAVADPSANPGLVTDCATLLQVRQALPEGSALNWSIDRPISEWRGIALGGSPLRVHELRLGNPAAIPTQAPSGLHRPLPIALGRLTQLRMLQLTGNQFTGQVPLDLGQLTNLRELYLASNYLSGPIPPELAQLPSLEVLDLSSNQLTGPIPQDFGRLTKLRRLNLAVNQLQGSIPSELSRLAGLTHLRLGSNEFTGLIPPELGRLASLILLSLGENQLSGPIPPELVQLNNLEFLDLADNRLSGSVPAELGQLRNLDLLSLNDNQLTGQIPSELGRMESLSGLDLSGNQLTGCISPDLDRLKPKPINVNDADLPVCEPAA